jgi:hypothetical protein
MYRSDRNYLFSEGDLARGLDANRRRIRELVDAIHREQFLATSVDTICEHIVAQLTVDPLVLHEDKMTMEHAETKIDVTHRFEYGGSLDGRPVMVDGHMLTFYIPLSGDADLWRARPSTFSLNPPRGDIDTRRKLLTLSFANTSQTEQSWFKQQLEGAMASIRQSIAAQLSQIQQHNASLPKAVQEAVAHRRDQLSKLHGLVSAFNIPLAQKPGMPEYKPVDVLRKQIQLPKVPVAGFKPEPAIADELYEAILANIRHMGATFEGTPQTYQALGEEGLRDILLASLNSVYQGRAAGEAFRHYGKTDIRIEEDTRSAFVAECKLWGGEQVLVSALEQLLDYLTWRDCKASLVLFNKGVAGFAGMQETIKASLRAHSNFLREKPGQPTGEWRFVFRSREDAGREVTVHVFCFNLYVAPARAGRKR